jgi:hypothetical protein
MRQIKVMQQRLVQANFRECVRTDSIRMLSSSVYPSLLCCVYQYRRASICGTSADNSSGRGVNGALTHQDDEPSSLAVKLGNL